MRINKYLTEANYCSRRQADHLIEQDRVTVNGILAVVGQRVQTHDRVFVDGKQIRPLVEKTYLAYHKPVGVICTTDRRRKNNIVDAVGYHARVYPVGRLDVATSGLIILTDDGSMVNDLLKGARVVEKEYVVDTDKTVTQAGLEKLERGVVLDGHKTLQARAKKIADKRFTLVLVEGKNRQVRRMCEAVGWNVVRLHRVRIGRLGLGALARGAYRRIDREEI